MDFVPVDILTPNPLRDKILERAKPGTIAQFKVKDDIIYQEEMTTFKKAHVILDMFKDFGIGCGMPKETIIDPIVIPLPHLTPPTMEALIKWCYKHKDDPDMTVEEYNDNLYHCTGNIKDSWDEQLYDDLDEDVLFDLLLASKYLGIPEMRDTLTTYIANIIVKGSEEEKEEKKKTDGSKVTLDAESEKSTSKETPEEAK